MDWKQQFSKANTKIKEGIKRKNAENIETAKKAGERVKGDIKQKAADKVNLEKDKIKNSGIGRFVRDTKGQGFKGKAKYIGKGALNKFKGTNLYRNMQKAVDAVDKIVKFVAANFVPICIVTGVIVLGTNIAIMTVGLTQAVGETPHYYCYTNPSTEVKNSKEYKQYCENDTSSVKMLDLNGHYVVQDGAGPCTSCSVLNMLIRFYNSTNVNIYDFLWQSNGQYSPVGNSLITADANQYNFRLFITGHEGKNRTEDWAAKPNRANGSIEFAASHGKENYTMANWGYCRDPALNGYADLAKNENWVWDLSLENDGPGTNWGCLWNSNRSVTIEGVTATFVHNEGAFRSLDQFKILLDAHPAGIVVYRNYGPDKNHAILVTGYAKNSDGSAKLDANGNLQFEVIDPAWGTSGGYIMPADQCIENIFTNAILNNPTKDSGILSYTYLDEG